MTPTRLPAGVRSRWPGPLADYWNDSRRPLSSLAFVLPLLVMYEAGVLLLGPAAIRNGADVWLRQLLDAMGLTGYFVLPLLTVGMLLAWHHTTRHAWHVSAPVLGGMLAESAALGLLLVVLAHLHGKLLAAVSIRATGVTVLGQLVAFFGAGIYEEVLFRLLLLPLLWGVLGLLGGRRTVRVVGAIVLSSLMFSAAHYVGVHGDRWEWFTFLFRFSAGSFFAALFVYRGFGIASGVHALYDIFVGIA